MAAPSPDADELASLERVLDRLGATDESRLEAVLSKLLPPLLGKLAPGLNPAVQGKVLAVLSHINKRVKERLQIALPVEELIAQLQTAAPFTANFIAVYVRMGFTRLSPPQLGALLPRLLEFSAFPVHARDLIVRMCLHALPHASFALGSDRAERFAAFASPDAEATVSAIALLTQTLLYTSIPRRNPSAFATQVIAQMGLLGMHVGAAGAGHARPQGGGGGGGGGPAEPAPLPLAQAGVSARSAALVGLSFDGTPISSDELAQRKRGAVALLGAPGVVKAGLVGAPAIALFPPELTLAAATAGCADAYHDVLAGAEGWAHGWGAAGSPTRPTPPFFSSLPRCSL
jgi:hypothetical protein